MALQPITAGDRTITGADRQRISDLLDRSVADNTRIMYASAWRSFEAWARARGRSHPLPASPELVAAYLAELAVPGKAVATVKLHRAALGAIHRSTGHQDPTDNEGVRQLLAGVARSNGKAQRQAKPLGAEALGAVRANGRQSQDRPQGAAGETLDGRKAGQGGCGPPGHPPRRPSPEIRGRGFALGRCGAAGGRGRPPARAPVENGSGGRGSSPLRQPGGRPGAAGHHAPR